MKRGLVIGRFQPLHNMHVALIARAITECDEVRVIVGSTGAKPNFKNPWYAVEVVAMIAEVFGREMAVGKLRVNVVEDVPYDDDEWAKNVLAAAPGVTDLYGFNKDESSYYLNLFHGLKFNEVTPPEQHRDLSATRIRQHLFGSRWPDMGTPTTNDWLHTKVHPAVLAYIVGRLPGMRNIHEQFKRLCRHNDQWESEGSMKYGVQHVCVDVLVETSRAILLVERADNGAVALPGGFVERHQTLAQAALAELEQETAFKVSDSLRRTLLGPDAIGALVPFDYPGRSLHGRVFTNALHIHARDEQPVRADLDPDGGAKRAFWLPKAQFAAMKGAFHDDHWHIANILMRRNQPWTN